MIICWLGSNQAKQYVGSNSESTTCLFERPSEGFFSWMQHKQLLCFFRYLLSSYPGDIFIVCGSGCGCSLTRVTLRTFQNGTELKSCWSSWKIIGFRSATEGKRKEKRSWLNCTRKPCIESKLNLTEVRPAYSIKGQTRKGEDHLPDLLSTNYNLKLKFTYSFSDETYLFSFQLSSSSSIPSNLWIHFRAQLLLPNTKWNRIPKVVLKQQI